MHLAVEIRKRELDIYLSHKELQEMMKIFRCDIMVNDL